MAKVGFRIDPYYELWKLLNETGDAIIKTRETEMAQVGISAAQGHTLFFLNAAEEPPTPAQLSRWLFRESQSVSGLLDRMERQGLIRRVKDLDRKNQVRVEITDRGRKVYRESTQRKSIERIMSSLSKEEQKQLKSSLQTLKAKASEELAMVRHQSYARSLV